MQRSDEDDPVKRIENMEPTLDVWADEWMKEVAPNMHHVTSHGHVTSNGVALTSATPNLGWPGGPQIWDAKNTGAMSGMDIFMQGFTPPHVIPNGVAPQYAPPTGDLSRDVQLRVDVNAVRAFLLSNTGIDGDLIDDIIQKGGVRKLAALKHLKEEDLTDPVLSIISPRVIPAVEARLLIKESIPKLFSHPAHVRIDLLSSPGDMIHDCHARVNAEHVIPHGLTPISHAPGLCTDSPGVSPTMSRGGLQAPSPTRLPVGTCSNCARQDASVALRCVSSESYEAPVALPSVLQYGRDVPVDGEFQRFR